MQTGVHFPSDIKMGKEIAYIITPQIVGPIEDQGLSVEIGDRGMIREFLLEAYGESPEKLKSFRF